MCKNNKIQYQYLFSSLLTEVYICTVKRGATTFILYVNILT